MSGGNAMLPLVIGALLAAIAVGFVLWPLWIDVFGVKAHSSSAPTAPVTGEQTESPIDVLREIELDRAMGKLSADDYGLLRARYTSEALASMRSAETSARRAPLTYALASPDDLSAMAESAIRLQRARRRGCASCGPRPEPDAVFCSNCGRFLSQSCVVCGAPVENVAARFCTSCGAGFAA